MRQMDQMMSSIMRDPFEDDPFFGRGGMAAITAGPTGASSNALVPRHHPQRARTASDPFSALGIPSIANMMSSVGTNPLVIFSNSFAFSASNSRNKKKEPMQ